MTQAPEAGAPADSSVSVTVAVGPAGQATADRPGHDGFTYLLVQLGARAARLFAERVTPLGIEPRHAGLLIRLAGSEGSSQQAIGELIGLSPTRMVFLVDELEQRGLIERRRNADDRRSYALYLTGPGRAMLAALRDTAAAHPGQLGSSLSQAERGELTLLLRKLAHEQGITEQSLPGAG